MLIYFFLVFFIMIIGYHIGKDLSFFLKIIDFSIIVLFFYYYFFKGLVIPYYLFCYFLFFLIVFCCYRLLNLIYINSDYLNLKFEKIFGLNRKKKIISFFMKPIFFEIVYYIIWFLPWNVGYFFFFFFSEYCWYLRVWIVSTRDVLFFKLFKWDSRDYFFQVNNRLYDSYLYKNISSLKLKLFKAILRILMFFHYLRLSYLKENIMFFLFLRIKYFMYLTIFFFCVLNWLQLANAILVIISLFLEFFFFFFWTFF